MKGSTGLLIFGVLFGAIGALVLLKMRKGEAEGDLASISDRIQTNLDELESRLAPDAH